MQALPFSSAAAAGRALARNRPCPNAVPAREMLLPFLAPSTCLAPCFEAETRPCSCGTSGQPLSAGRLVCLARLSDSLPAHLAAWPRSMEHQGSRKTAHRARPASPGLRQIPWPGPGGERRIPCRPSVTHKARHLKPQGGKHRSRILGPLPDLHLLLSKKKP